jgi:DNA-3-methyladenine glycosylase I
MQRCAWAQNASPLMTAYHDEEWGVPLYDERRLFEFLVLEGAQAGLSWNTILNKREHYRESFDNFDIEKIARYNEAQLEALMFNPGIVRNRLKIASVVQNARAALAMRKAGSSLVTFLWSFTGGKPLRNSFQSLEEIPAQTSESQAMSRALKKCGFTFVGPTICYAFMQAVGMVNDHEVSCFRWAEIDALSAG